MHDSNYDQEEEGFHYVLWWKISICEHTGQSMWLIMGFSGKLDSSKFKHAQRIWLNRLIVC